MSTSVFRNKNMVRPKKAAAPRRRRRMLQQKRLQALGVPEEKIVHMTSKQVRDLLKRPKQTAAMNWS